MPRGDKSAYTDKQKRQAAHIEASEKKQGRPESVAERIAWATINKQDGGGKRSGSARKTAEKATSDSSAARKTAKKVAPKKSIATKATSKRAGKKSVAKKAIKKAAKKITR